MDNNNNFYPNIGFGNILFKQSQDEISSILGLPQEKEIDQVNDSDYTVIYLYTVLGYSLHFHYENNILEYFSIHLKRIIFNGEDLSTITKGRIIEVIKNYYLREQLTYDGSHSFDKDMDEEIYSFDAIGLTIWFEKNQISDICINEVIR